MDMALSVRRFPPPWTVPQRRELNATPGMDLLNPDLIFGTAWFWTLPEVHDPENDTDALAREFRRLFPATAPNAHSPLPITMDS